MLPVVWVPPGGYPSAQMLELGVSIFGAKADVTRYVTCHDCDGFQSFSLKDRFAFLEERFNSFYMVFCCPRYLL